MPDLTDSLLDAFPGAVVLIQGNTVVSANPMARHYLPQLETGAGLPPFLPQGGGELSGTFSSGASQYTFRLTNAPQGRWLLFQPAPQTALTDLQLDGVLRQMRTLLSQFLSAWEGGLPAPDTRASMRRTFYQSFRLLDNLDYLHLAASGEGIPFHPVTMDFAGLCRQVVDCAAPLLAQVGNPLSMSRSPATLLIPGDPVLLQRLLLELIANAVRAAGSGNSVSLALSVQGSRALLSLTHSGSIPTPRQLSALLQQDTDQALPAPNAGAGLGLPVARHIVSLHGGVLLLRCGEEVPAVVLSLPTGPAAGLSVQTPKLQRDGGLSPLLVGLADVLSPQVFTDEDLS